MLELLFESIIGIKLILYLIVNMRIIFIIIFIIKKYFNHIIIYGIKINNYLNILKIYYLI